MTHILLCELAAFALYFAYGSFFEWFFHRYLFHSPKYIYRTFREHTLVHHQIYKGDDTYHTHEDHPNKVPMDWWALPLMVAWHLPLFIAVQHFTGVPSLWGGVAAISVYYTLYESFHWAMHVPRASRFLSRFHPYRFLDAHHRVHHKHMLSNLNVLFPLADLTLGTLRDASGRRVVLFPKLRGEKTKTSQKAKRAKNTTRTVKSP